MKDQTNTNEPKELKLDIAFLRQRIQELNAQALQQESIAKEAANAALRMRGGILTYSELLSLAEGKPLSPEVTPPNPPTS